MKLILGAVLLRLFTVLESSPVPNDQTAMKYLQKYGYLEESFNVRAGTASMIRREAISRAVKDFQRFSGLKQTGKLDNQTLAKMTSPRCGVRDIDDGLSAMARKKRYAHQGSKWRVSRLTYRISKYPSRIKDRQKVDREMAKALKVWSDVTSLTFEERKRGRVNIDIRFEKRDHGDGDPFDGPGETLAHARFPRIGGDAHFDDEEMWTIEGTEGTNMLHVAAHEFGHSLGLDHSDEENALMAPFYEEDQSLTRLHRDDLTAIQALYGKGASANVSPVEDEPISIPTDIRDAPDLCQDAKIDTITRTQNGSTYVFKGQFYWKIISKGKPPRIANGYPRRISDDWDGLDGNLDASLTWTTGKTFFFKGSQYWRFTDRKMDPDYPRPISVGFEGLPNNLGAAFVWSRNGKTYFFKGDQYWRYDSNSEPPISEKYPRPISNWKYLPENVDTAFQWENSRTYFFKGDKYYRFNDASFAVDTGDPSFPRSTATWWFGCQSVSDGNDEYP